MGLKAEPGDDVDVPHAVTVHRLLEVGTGRERTDDFVDDESTAMPNAGWGWVFRRNAHNPLDCDGTVLHEPDDRDVVTCEL